MFYYIYKEEYTNRLEDKEDKMLPMPIIARLYAEHLKIL